MAQNDIYQLKVTLKHSKPPIWRRLQVPGQTRLHKLHLILQAAMGWWDEHLHQFTAGQITYSELRPDLEMGEPEFMDESKYRLDQIAPGEKSRFVYEYDFGDGWEHVILVEKVLPPEQGVHYPRCIKGKRACPPEDIGGVWGYGYFLEAIKDPNHPEHDHMREWVGDDFDPEAFDLDGVNQDLQRIS